MAMEDVKVLHAVLPNSQSDVSSDADVHKELVAKLEFLEVDFIVDQEKDPPELKVCTLPVFEKEMEEKEADEPMNREWNWQNGRLLDAYMYKYVQLNRGRPPLGRNRRNPLSYPCFSTSNSIREGGGALNGGDLVREISSLLRAGTNRKLLMVSADLPRRLNPNAISAVMESQNQIFSPSQTTSPSAASQTRTSRPVRTAATRVSSFTPSCAMSH